MTQPLLRAQHISRQFGGLIAVDDVSFDVYPGEVLTLIGPNGAGKSTVFNVISRIYPQTSGQLEYQGKDLGGVAPHQIAWRGIARTFQNIELFEHATVLSNLLIGHHIRSRTNLLSDLLFLPSTHRQEIAAREHVENEPSSGLNPEETDELVYWIRDIVTEMGATVMMVEHDMSLVLRVSSRVVAMNQGRVIAVGTPQEVQSHPEVISAYLGSEAAS